VLYISAVNGTDGDMWWNE